MEFFDVKRGMASMFKDYTLKQKNKTGEREMTRWSLPCDTPDGCEVVANGTYYIDEYEWIELSPSMIAHLPEGNITVGIFLDVGVGEHGEFIPTWMDVRIEEWAEWSDGLNTDLLSYYKLDGTGGAVVDSVGNYDGINNGAGRGDTGIIGNAFNFTTENSDWVNTTSRISDISDTNWTINVWFNPETNAFRHILTQGVYPLEGIHIYTNDASGTIRAQVNTDNFGFRLLVGNCFSCWNLENGHCS